MTRFFILILFFPTLLTGQEMRTISGKITDGFEPLADVAITREGTDSGTFTNNAGRYEIRAGNGDVLVYRLRGMKEVRIRVEDVTRYLNIRMHPEYTELDEVTVTARDKQEDLQIRYATDKQVIRTAYGYVDAARNSGRVKILSDEDINPIGICILGLLRNRFAGLTVTGNCLQGGEVFIRGGFTQTGLSSVVYDIDGMVFTETPLWLDINLIKRLAIFYSRSSATRYGSASAGGVIVINTVNINYGPADGEVLGAAPRLHVQAISHGLIEKGAPVYLQALRNTVSAEEAKMVYAEYAPRYSASPFYFLDAYSYFYKEHGAAMADSVIAEEFEKFAGNAVLLKALGYIYQAQNRHQKALEVFQKIYALRPAYSQSYLDLANAYRDVGHHRRAAAIFGRYQYLLKEGFLEGSDDFWLLQQHDNDNLFQMEGRALGVDQRKLSIDEYVQNTTRLVFEWNDSEAEFNLQFVNPDSRVFNWEHSNQANALRIEDEKISGYGTQEYIIDPSTPGDWRVNVTYLGNKSFTPTYLKVTAFFHFGSPRQKKVVNTYKLMSRGVNQELFTLSTFGLND